MCQFSDLIIENSKKYFQTHINRKIKFGQRDEKTVIYDSWINPQIKSLSLKEICDAFFQNKLEHISSHPSITPLFHIISYNEICPDYYNYRSYSSYYKFLEKVWMCYEGNKFELIDDVKIVDKEHKKLLEMKKKLDEGTLSVRDFSQWENSRMGIGIHFFVGRKKSCL